MKFLIVLFFGHVSILANANIDSILTIITNAKHEAAELIDKQELANSKYTIVERFNAFTKSGPVTTEFNGKIRRYTFKIDGSVNDKNTWYAPYSDSLLYLGFRTRSRSTFSRVFYAHLNLTKPTDYEKVPKVKYEPGDNTRTSPHLYVKDITRPSDFILKRSCIYHCLEFKTNDKYVYVVIAGVELYYREDVYYFIDIIETETELPTFMELYREYVK